jgi:nitroimidazol reductase NimA-like FMN-containing flavoprotein (pyridoxamine 5'-phosphate oxidase superfamily)
MSDNDMLPVTDLHPNFSSENATPTPWSEARRRLEEAELYWLTTVRPDGRPHVTPVVSVWLDGALYFSTGPEEHKAKNLAGNTHCIITTGCNTLAKGLDLVVEGEAVRLGDETRLLQIADKFNSKYGPPFQYTVRDGAFSGEGGEALVYELRPSKAFGFGRGQSFSQTRRRF